MKADLANVPRWWWRVFGMLDLIAGLALLAGGSSAAGIGLAVIGLLLLGTAYVARWLPRGEVISGFRYSSYAYSYALISGCFLVGFILLLSAGISALSADRVGRAVLAFVGAVLFLLLALGGTASLLAARTIARGKAGNATRWWLPGWRLFIDFADEPNSHARGK